MHTTKWKRIKYDCTLYICSTSCMNWAWIVSFCRKSRKESLEGYEMWGKHGLRCRVSEGPALVLFACHTVDVPCLRELSRQHYRWKSHQHYGVGHFPALHWTHCFWEWQLESSGKLLKSLPALPSPKDHIKGRQILWGVGNCELMMPAFTYSLILGQVLVNM